MFDVDESPDVDVSRPPGEAAVTLDDVYRAQRVIEPILPRTPFVRHPLLDSALGCEAQVKLENCHDIGSFKIRGSLNLLSRMPAERREAGLVTATKGNHGQSLARAAALYDADCTIFVPEGNNADKNRAMAALGADVRISGHDFDAAWAAAARFAAATGAVAVHPAREAALVAGVATVALEMLAQSDGPLDYVFVPVGGGSIAAGVAVVLQALSPATRLVAVQSAGAPAMYRAWQSGHPQVCPVSATIADGLAVRKSVAFTLDLMRDGLHDMCVVSDSEIVAAMQLYATVLHQMVEGAGAAALAGALQMRADISGARIGLVVTGGNVEAHTFIDALSGTARYPDACGHSHHPRPICAQGGAHGQADDF